MPSRKPTKFTHKAAVRKQMKQTLVTRLGSGGGNLPIDAAAKVIADLARAYASFSTKIPQGIYVKPFTEFFCEVIAQGGEARAFEYGERHPLFGNRNHWYPTEHKPFMETAMTDGLPGALRAWSDPTIDKMLATKGWR